MVDCFPPSLFVVLPMISEGLFCDRLIVCSKAMSATTPLKHRIIAKFPATYLSKSSITVSQMLLKFSRSLLPTSFDFPEIRFLNCSIVSNWFLYCCCLSVLRLQSSVHIQKNTCDQVESRTVRKFIIINTSYLRQFGCSQN